MTPDNISSAWEISRQMGVDKVAEIDISAECAYLKDGEIRSAFQRGEVVIRIKFESGKIMTCLLSDRIDQ